MNTAAVAAAAAKIITLFSMMAKAYRIPMLQDLKLNLNLNRKVLKSDLYLLRLPLVKMGGEIRSRKCRFKGLRSAKAKVSKIS